MAFWNKKKAINSCINGLYEDTLNRARDLKDLVHNRNRLDLRVIEIAGKELERLKREQLSFNQVWKFTEIPVDLVSEYKHQLSDLIREIEFHLSGQIELGRQIGIKYLFYPQLIHDTSKAKTMEIFAGFEPLDSDDELPRFSYGIKFTFDSDPDTLHVFDSSSDGCIMSGIANIRRARSLNLIVSIAEDILQKVFDHRISESEIKVSIRTDIPIYGFHCPDGWYVNNIYSKEAQTYREVRIIPTRNFESLIAQNISTLLWKKAERKVRIFSRQPSLADNDFTGIKREFGVTFSDENSVYDTLIFDESIKDDVALYVKKINKVISIMDYYYYYYAEFRMTPLIKMEIDIDFDKEGVFCPPNFTFSNNDDRIPSAPKESES